VAGDESLILNLPYPGISVAFFPVTITGGFLKDLQEWISRSVEGRIYFFWAKLEAVTSLFSAMME